MSITSIIQVMCRVSQSASFRELVRFGIVGVAATLIQYGVYYAINQVVGWGATISLTIGYGISFVFNFFLSNYFTFKTRPTMKKGIGFGVSHIINYCMQILFLNIYMYVGIPQEYAPIPMFVTVIPINFILVRTVLKSKKL